MGCCCNGGNSNGGSWVEGNFTIIYPNNGSKDKPADVKANERIVLDNPFKGYHVSCEAQVLYKGSWGKTGWLCNASGIFAAYGVSVGQELPSDKIIVQTGGIAVCSYAPYSGGVHIVPGNQFTLPCRVLVTQLAAIESDDKEIVS